MDNQQYNLYSQPRQSGQPTEQQAAEPPKSNKLWPINWRHNRVFKFFSIFSILSFIIYFLSSLSHLYLSLGTFRSITDGFLILLNAWYFLVRWLEWFFFPVTFLLCLIIIISYLIKIRKKEPDKADRLFLRLNIFIIIVTILLSGFLHLFSCMSC